MCDAVVKNRGRCSEKGAAEVFVCIFCNRLSARVYKMTAQNKDLQTTFGALVGEEKQQWMQRHADFHGADLKKAIANITSLSLSDEQVDNFLANGKWLDEIDLDDKYKNKLEQLEEIKKRARTFVHPTRQVTLYEDLDFDSSAGVLSKRKEETRVEAQSFDTIKKVKKQKTENVEPNVKESALEEKKTNQKQLSDKQKEKYKKLEQKFSAASNSLKEAVAIVEQPEYAGYIGKAIRDQATQILMTAKTQQAALEMMLEDGWEGKASEVEKACRENMAQAQSATTRLLRQIEDAEEIIPLPRES